MSAEFRKGCQKACQKDAIPMPEDSDSEDSDDEKRVKRFQTSKDYLEQAAKRKQLQEMFKSKKKNFDALLASCTSNTSSWNKLPAVTLSNSNRSAFSPNSFSSHYSLYLWRFLRLLFFSYFLNFGYFSDSSNLSNFSNFSHSFA